MMFTPLHRSRTLAALLLALSVTHSLPAHAGPVEQFAQVALHPANPDVLALRYEQGGDGIFYSRDRGATWALTCTTAIDASLTSSFAAGVAADGTLMLSGQLGASAEYAKSLWQDDAHGCGFSRVNSLMDTWLSDIQPHPTDPDVLFGVSSGLDAGRRNGLWKRSADGTWSEVGPRERAMISRLRVAKTPNGLRMYESALRETPAADAGTDGGGAATYDFVIRVSDDEGQSWEEHAYGMTPSSASLRLEAVDPTNPDVIVASLGIKDVLGVPSQDTQDLVLVSTDRGETFRTYQTLTEIGGALFTPDGALWLGDVGSIFDSKAPRGLWTAASLDMPAHKVADEPIQCLTYQPASDTLYACQRQSLSSVDRETGKFSTLLRAVAATRMASCAGQDIAAACETQLCGAYCGAGHFAQAPLCQVYDTPFCGPSVAIGEGAGDAGISMSSQDSGPATLDSGSAGSGALDAGEKPSPTTSSSSDCGCSVLGSHETSGVGWPWAVAGLLVTRRRLWHRSAAKR